MKSKDCLLFTKRTAVKTKVICLYQQIKDKLPTTWRKQSLNRFWFTRRLSNYSYSANDTS